MLPSLSFLCAALPFALLVLQTIRQNFGNLVSSLANQLLIRPLVWTYENVTDAGAYVRLLTSLAFLLCTPKTANIYLPVIIVSKWMVFVSTRPLNES